MKITFIDRNKEVCEALRKYFYSPEFDIIHGDFESVHSNYDCVVSPANSFGLMDGGFDLALTRKFGTQLQERVQKYIIKNFKGEQPVGTAFMIEATGFVNENLHKYVIHAPTMRVPKSIVGTDNVYNAMRAILSLTDTHILCSGLGTEAGRMHPLDAAYQMWLAYQAHVNPIEKINWIVASKRENDLSYPQHNVVL